MTEFPIYDRHFAIKTRGEKVPSSLSNSELLIHTHEFMLSFQELIESDMFPNTIIFLDRSARPISFFFRKLFREYYPDESISQPQVIFGDVGQLLDSGEDNLSKLFGKYFQQESKALIVDECSFLGIGLQRTLELYSRTFNEVQFSTKVVYPKFPVWYDQPKLLGVKDRSLLDFIKAASQRVNRKYGTKINYFRYDCLSDEEKNLLQDELNVVLGHNSINLEQFQSDFYKKKKLRTIKMGNIPSAIRAFDGKSATKNTFLAFRREQEHMCQRILDLKETILEN